MIHAVKRQGAATERTRPPSESHITLNAQGDRRARSSVRPSVRQGRHSVLLKLLPMSRRLLNETGGGIRKGRLNDRKTQVSVWSGGRPCHTDGLTDGPIAEWLPLAPYNNRYSPTKRKRGKEGGGKLVNRKRFWATEQSAGGWAAWLLHYYCVTLVVGKDTSWGNLLHRSRLGLIPRASPNNVKRGLIICQRN